MVHWGAKHVPAKSGICTAGLSSDQPEHLSRKVESLILKPEFTIDDFQERVAVLCENVKTYHPETGFVGGLVALNTGNISNEGSTIDQAVESELKNKEALIITFWNSFEEHEKSHVAKPSSHCLSK